MEGDAWRWLPDSDMTLGRAGAYSGQGVKHPTFTLFPPLSPAHATIWPNPAGIGSKRKLTIVEHAGQQHPGDPAEERRAEFGSGGVIGSSEHSQLPTTVTDRILLL